ncbi:MAG: amidohydrolase family protein [Planctomycetota bacterium]
MQFLRLSITSLFILALCSNPVVAQDDSIAFVGAKIIPIRGDEIEDGVLVVQGGKIQAVGKATDVSIPDGARQVDAKNKTIMPGLICTHSHIGGIGAADGSGPIQPGVRVYESLNVRDSGFKRALAGGLTTLNIMPGSGHLISGQTIYVKLRFSVGRDGTPTKIDDIFIRDKDDNPVGGLKMANGTNSIRDAPFPGTRGKSAFLVREQYIKAREYQAKINRAEGDASKLPPRDLHLETLVEAMQGKRIVHHHTHRHDDIMTVLRLSKEFGFPVVLHHVSEGWRVADEIAKAGAPCSMILVDSPGGKLEARYLLMRTGKILEDAGVRTAFHTDDWITDSRIFFRMAALSVRAGMSRKMALEGLTLAGAEMLGLDQRIGSLEPGKDADFIVLNGDPFSVYSKVEQTWVEGRPAFDRSNEEDRLYAVGGYGAGHDQAPYFCCFGSN